jgi:N-methylhydantoinase B
VSVAGARSDYGVVVGDPAATAAARDSLRAARTGREPFFDRGPGFPTLAGGRTYAEVDLQ